MARKNPVKKTISRLKTTADTTRMALTPIGKSPDEALGELFSAVQLNRVHNDGKTFVDLIPKNRLAVIVKAYKNARTQPNFDLAAFVKYYFQPYLTSKTDSITYADDPEQHINHLWDVQTRKNIRTDGSLLPLPYPYIVPGGRFQEQFYWDSYFIMLGLEASKRYELSDGIMANCDYMIRKFGFIPTGNRTYFTTRSQPPLYMHMVRLVGARQGKAYVIRHLPYLLREYAFWTKNPRNLWGLGKLKYQRVVTLLDGSQLSCYSDSKATPRPESYSADKETAHYARNALANLTYRHLRAGAESGWDYSSRWFQDKKHLETIQTAEIVPIDLNCLLYELEMLIANCYKKLFQPALVKTYQKKAAKRKHAIDTYLWNEVDGFYYDYHAPSQTQTGVASLAACFTLFNGIASRHQAARLVKKLEAEFLKPGGLMTTLNETGQQWDAPNGWAPLQWITIVGLRRYSYNKLADDIKCRWLACNLAVYQHEHKFVEKYDVVNPGIKGGGGEYKLQDGFGWTNGVFMALRHNLDETIGQQLAN